MNMIKNGNCAMEILKMKVKESYVLVQAGGLWVQEVQPEKTLLRSCLVSKNLKDVEGTLS